VKGLETSLIWAVILATVSVVVLIALTTDTFQPIAYRIYCDIYLKTVGFFSRTESSSIPTFCKQYANQGVQVVEINDQDKQIVARDLLAYIIACWKDTEINGQYQTHTCYEVHFNKPVEDVSEKDVTQVLIKEDQCKSIENSDYGCGTANQIIWEIGDSVISNQKIVLIEYNHDKDAIRVIG